MMCRDRISGVTLALVILMSSLSATDIIVPDAEGAMPTVTVRADSATIVESHPCDRYVIVQIIGTVEANAVRGGFHGFEQIHVMLECTSTALNWTFSPHPHVFTNAGGTEQFRLWLSYPPLGPNGTLVDSVIIGGRARTVPGLSYNIPDTQVKVFLNTTDDRCILYTNDGGSSSISPRERPYGPEPVFILAVVLASIWIAVLLNIRRKLRRIRSEEKEEERRRGRV